MKITIAIPTYWVLSKKHEYVHEAYELYDHPTRIKRYETLSRLLDSFKILDFGDNEVKIVVLIATDPFLPNREKRIEKLVKTHSGRLDIMTISEPNSELLMDYIKERGFPEIAKGIGLFGYSKIRNTALVVSQILESDAVLFIDDDEAIIDKEFLKKAIELASKKNMGGVGGLYVNRKGNYKLDDEPSWWKIFWNKERQLNKSFEILEKPEGENKINVVFGGNMFIKRKTFEKIPFDYLVERGEDADYLMNTKHFGFEFPLKKELRILHLPHVSPSLYFSTYWSKLRGDIYRFFYTRYKIRGIGMEADALDPYPGYFLKPDLTARAASTSLFLVIASFLRREFESVLENLRNIWIALFDARRYAKKYYRDYFSFQKKWEKFMPSVRGDKKLLKILNLD